MTVTPFIERCRAGIKQLNDELHWNLDASTQECYAQYLSTSLDSTIDDQDLLKAIQNYHYDHEIVEALMDQQHHTHEVMWESWRRHFTGMIANKLLSTSLYDASLLNLEDLVQEALQDIWKGLPRFNYRSRFSTWAFQVAVNCFQRQIRTVKAEKRTGHLWAQSIDALQTDEETVADAHVVEPGQRVFDDTLLKLVHTALAAASDDRLATIFRLWHDEEQTLRAIGDQFHLSPTRVYVLLKQASALLQTAILEQGWLESPPTPQKRAGRAKQQPVPGLG